MLYLLPLSLFSQSHSARGLRESHYSYTCGKNRPFILIVVVNTNQRGYWSFLCVWSRYSSSRLLSFSCLFLWEGKTNSLLVTPFVFVSNSRILFLNWIAVYIVYLFGCWSRTKEQKLVMYCHLVVVRGSSLVMGVSVNWMIWLWGCKLSFVSYSHPKTSHWSVSFLI